METRLDKCLSFGMRKSNGIYQQYLPYLTIMNEQIPHVKIGSFFTYLGKKFDFNMDNAVIETDLISRLKTLLQKTSDLNVRPQMKLKILKLYIPSQLSFDLRIYDLSYTWIDQNLDSLITRAVSDWMSFSRDTCIKEMLELPKSMGGFEIPLLKSRTKKLRLSLRFCLRNNPNSDLRNIWRETSKFEPQLDSLISIFEDRKNADKDLDLSISQTAYDHIFSLKSQGIIPRTIKESFSKSDISNWSSQINSLPTHLFIFIRKAFLQQLPTAANLQKWKKLAMDNCLLCGSRQTNKHVLSHCNSPQALSRFKTRHDNILRILADWISENSKPNSIIHVDLEVIRFKPLEELFTSFRPDIAIVNSNSISTLELTVCHETNIVKSREFKQSKYIHLKSNLLPKFRYFDLNQFTIEITTLGFISDSSQFSKINLTDKMSDKIKFEILKSVVSDSYSIYCQRNNKTV